MRKRNKWASTKHEKKTVYLDRISRSKKAKFSKIIIKKKEGKQELSRRKHS